MAVDNAIDNSLVKDKLSMEMSDPEDLDRCLSLFLACTSNDPDDSESDKFLNLFLACSTDNRLDNDERSKSSIYDSLAIFSFCSANFFLFSIEGFAFWFPSKPWIWWNWQLE